MSIFVNDEFLGVAGGCGCLEKEEEIDTFLIKQTTGINEEDLVNLAEDIPLMTRSEAETIAAYIKNIIDGLLKINFGVQCSVATVSRQ